MSTVKVESEAPTSTQVRIPKQNYWLRILEEPEFKMTKEKPNKDGVPTSYPMLTFKCEIIRAGKQIVDGEEVDLDGKEIKLYALFFKDRVNPEVENSAQVGAIHRQANLPLEFSRDEETGLPINDEGVPISYAGVEFQAVCFSDEYTSLDDNGKPLVNPITGEIQKGWNYKVGKVW
jgi:hypothetical protein